MTTTSNIIEPNFVLVTFDIPATAGSDRSYILRKLRANGFVMWTQSVYYGLFSPTLMQDVIAFAKTRDNITLTVTTPMFPSDQSQYLAQKYDAQFVEQWTECELKLQDIEAMLEDRLLYKDKKTGNEIPYTPAQIAERLKYIDSLIGDLEHALAKRMQNEKITENKRKSFETLGHRLRTMDNYATRMKESNSHRLKRLLEKST